MTAAESALVFAGDEGFARGLAVAIHSALAGLAPDFRPQIFVLDAGLSESSRARLLRVAAGAGRSDDLCWIRPPAERLAHLPSHGRFTPASYARLLIPELVPSRIRRAVYLDADVLVRRDLSALLATGLGDAPFGAVRDSGPRRGGSNGVESRAYFNTGVLLIDVAGWRRAGLTDRALAYAAAGDAPLPFLDQDALNAVAESWHELDHRWNLQLWNLALAKRRLLTDRYAYRQDRDLYRTAAVLHFTGPKPWHHACETRGTTLWVRALIRSGWYARAEALRWLSRWLGKRAMSWPAIARRRWRARLEALGRSARQLARR